MSIQKTHLMVCEWDQEFHLSNEVDLGKVLACTEHTGYQTLPTLTGLILAYYIRYITLFGLVYTTSTRWSILLYSINMVHNACTKQYRPVWWSMLLLVLNVAEDRPSLFLKLWKQGDLPKSGCCCSYTINTFFL